MQIEKNYKVEILRFNLRINFQSMIVLIFIQTGGTLIHR